MCCSWYPLCCDIDSYFLCFSAQGQHSLMHAAIINNDKALMTSLIQHTLHKYLVLPPTPAHETHCFLVQGYCLSVNWLALYNRATMTETLYSRHAYDFVRVVGGKKTKKHLAIFSLKLAEVCDTHQHWNTASCCGNSFMVTCYGCWYL